MRIFTAFYKDEEWYNYYIDKLASLMNQLISLSDSMEVKDNIESLAREGKHVMSKLNKMPLPQKNVKWFTEALWSMVENIEKGNEKAFRSVVFNVNKRLKDYLKQYEGKHKKKLSLKIKRLRVA